MPGSNILCQGLSAAYNSLYLVSNNLTNTTVFSGLSIANNTLTVQSPAANFPFATGDLVYFSPNGNIDNRNLMIPYYAIVISPTQMQLATSLANAQQGTFDTLEDSPITNTGYNNGSFFQKVVSNTKIPVSRLTGFRGNSHFAKTHWLSSAYSSQTFFLQDKIRFDFTLSGTGILAGITTINNAYAICVGKGGESLIMGKEDSALDGGFTFTGSSVRMTINSGVVSVSYLSGGSYITVYTTVPLTNTTPCKFFSFNSLNNTGLRDCTITYF
jgi:hypothetical protein